MNKLLTICFLTISIVPFSQSKKEKYKILQQECTILERKNDSIHTKLEMISKSISKKYDEYNLSYSKLDNDKYQFEIAQKKYYNTVDDYNEFINLFKLSYLNPIILFDQETSPNIMDHFSLKIDTNITKKLFQKFEIPEKTNYSKKINYLLAYKDSLINWQNFNVIQTVSFQNEEILLKQKTREVYDLRFKFYKLTSKYKDLENGVIDELLQLAKEIKTSKVNKHKNLEIPLNIDRYFFYYEKRSDFGALSAPLENFEDSKVDESQNTIDTNIIYDIVDKQAEFPGGMSAAREYLKNNMTYPKTAKDMGIEGKCYLKFIISKSGDISNVKVVRGLQDCPECDQEAIRLLKSMPNWEPGKVNGKPVNSTFTIPVPFKL